MEEEDGAPAVTAELLPPVAPPGPMGIAGMAPKGLGHMHWQLQGLFPPMPPEVEFEAPPFIPWVEFEEVELLPERLLPPAPEVESPPAPEPVEFDAPPAPFPPLFPPPAAAEL